MMRAAAIACLLAVPATAQQMNEETCRAGWASFNEITDQTDEMTAALPLVTNEGWCRIDDSVAPLKPQDFGSVEWRGEGLAEAVEGQGLPESLQAEFDGIDLVEGFKLPLDAALAGPIGTMSVRFNRDPKSRAFELEDWTTRFGDLGRLTISAKGGGIDLSSLSAMQITSGGLRVNEIDLRLVTTPRLSRALLQDMPVPTAQIIIEAIPSSSIDAASRDTLSRFLTRGPKGKGRLHLSITSKSGIGIIQVVSGVMPLERAELTPEVLSNALGILLNGVKISADWASLD